MQTQLAADIKSRPEGAELNTILRSCVHCGFCTATCPTYQLLGDELDGPRGRIYLLKQMLEGQPVTSITQQHLDRCLVCRACETTCPSGVRYGRLLNIGRGIVEQKVNRTVPDRIKRKLMAAVFPYQSRFGMLLRIARLLRPLLPSTLQQKIPVQQQLQRWPQPRHQRKVLFIPGCVQPVLAPNIDVAAARVLDRLGISLIKHKTSACCGALNYHLSDHDQALQFAKNYIDTGIAYLDQGFECIVMTASGCGVMVKEYRELFQYDAVYAEKAARVSAMTKDISEILLAEDLTKFTAGAVKVAFQSPCTLQHGQALPDAVESILRKIGFNLLPVANEHLCCGSAGVYSLLEAELSSQLLRNKLAALEEHGPDVIATANIGCLTHLQSGTTLKIVHWIELLANI